MPEYLAPGVYVEEVSFRSKAIEGLSTTTTGFIGPARYGPIDQVPDIITSVVEFERVYGDRSQLNFDPQDPTALTHNYLWHAVRSFFEEGGQRLYIVRVFSPFSLDKDGHFIVDQHTGLLARGTYVPPPDDIPPNKIRKTSDGLYEDGHARAILDTGHGGAVQVRASYPGDTGNVRVRFTLRIGQNILGVNPIQVKGLLDDDVVWVSDAGSPITSPPGSGTLYRAERYFDTNSKGWTWRFHPGVTSPAGAPLELSQLTASDEIRVVTLTVTLVQNDGTSLVWSGLSFDPNHTLNGLKDSVFARFTAKPTPSLPIVITMGNSALDGVDIVHALFSPDIIKTLADPTASDADRSVDVLLTGGNDGLRPGANEYEGTADPDTTVKTGLMAFEDIDEISIVAAPGSTYGYENGYRLDASTIIDLLIAHVEKMRYRIAIIDSGDGQTISQVRALRAKIDSSWAALYYPWVLILDPVTRVEISVPPSGSVAGIYARNDTNRAVYKAPANEVVNLALGFELMLNKAQQEVLNPEGINCFRFFEDRGFRLWGARTASSDPEWKYVNLRRYFAYLEHSIDKGTQWAVFEPNGPQLWANVRRTIESFLLNEWQSGALLGDKPETSFFVRCDRTTMTQNDIDNGRLICLIGVAPLRPAEFVIFRIGQAVLAPS